MKKSLITFNSKPTMRKILFSCILAVVTYGNLFAQQDIMVSQYMFNGLFLNPAYAGSHKYMGASLLHRQQWVNFEGAPVTSIFAIDGPFAKRKMGWGLLVASEKIGPTSRTDFFGNYLLIGHSQRSSGARRPFAPAAKGA